MLALHSGDKGFGCLKAKIILITIIYVCFHPVEITSSHKLWLNFVRPVRKLSMTRYMRRDVI